MSLQSLKLAGHDRTTRSVHLVMLTVLATMSLNNLVTFMRVARWLNCSFLIFRLPKAKNFAKHQPTCPWYARSGLMH